MKKGIDLRVIKTLKSIEDSFLQCIKRKTFSEITVSDICNQAIINRSTFYKYYADKFELRSKLIEHVLSDFYQTMDLTAFMIHYNQLGNYRAVLEESLHFIFEKKELYLLMWKPNIEYPVHEEMIRLTEKKMKNNADEIYQKQHEVFDGTFELFTRLFASSALTVIQWWFEYAPQTGAHQVADIIIKNIQDGMYQAFLNPSTQK